MGEENFAVLLSPVMGRYAVASRDLSPGQLIHEEAPFVIGPKCDSVPVCLECLNPSENRCSFCSWPLCPSCREKSWSWHTLECDIFRNSRAVFQKWKASEKCPQLDCITPLRLLVQVRNNPQKWRDEVSLMEFHDEARRLSPNWDLDAVNIVNYLLMITDEFDRDLIERCIGILDVNSFEARTSEGSPVRCLYPRFGVIAHSCIPNTSHSIAASNDFSLQAFTTTEVSRSSPLFATYTFTLSTTRLRQEHIKKSKYFDCRCERCLSPTELDTHLSSFKCIRCDVGTMLPLDPVSPDEDWKCTDCGGLRYGADIHGTVAVLQQELNEILTLPSSRVAEELGYFYDAVGKVVHSGHLVLQLIRYHLIVALSEKIEDLNEVEVVKVVKYCEGLLGLLGVIEPGSTRFRAEILLYLSKASLRFLELNQTGFSGALRGIEKGLAECKEALRYEDPSSREGSMKAEAERLLGQLNL